MQRAPQKFWLEHHPAKDVREKKGAPMVEVVPGVLGVVGLGRRQV